MAEVGGGLIKTSLIYEPSNRIHVDSRRRPDMERLMGLKTVRTTLLLEAQTSLGERFVLEAALPFQRVLNTATGTDDSVDNMGLSDGLVTLHARLPKPERLPLAEPDDDAPKQEARAFHPVIFSLGVRIPTGGNDGKNTRGQPIAEQSLQLGQGVPSVEAGARGWTHVARDLTVFGRFEARMHFFENKHLYRYGSAFEANAGIERAIAERFGVSGQLALQHVRPDRYDDDIADSTGRTDLYVTLGFAAKVNDEFGVRGFVGMHTLGRQQGLQLVAPIVFWLRAYYEI